MKNYCEIVGQLEKINTSNDTAELVFNIKKQVTVPKEMVDLEKIESYIGQKIGILNIDGNFHFRVMKN